MAFVKAALPEGGSKRSILSKVERVDPKTLAKNVKVLSKNTTPKTPTTNTNKVATSKNYVVDEIRGVGSSPTPAISATPNNYMGQRQQFGSASHSGGSLRSGSSAVNYTPDLQYSNKPFIPTEKDWLDGVASKDVTSGNQVSPSGFTTQVTDVTSMAIPQSKYYQKVLNLTPEEEAELKKKLPSSVTQDMTVEMSTHDDIWSDLSKRNELLNENRSMIQNENLFPYYSNPSQGYMAAKYDYQIIPGDPKYDKMISLEDKLKECRAAFGIHVHGNNDIARAVKYNMYNRYKTIDTNLLFSKMTTHVFFTRPDLNLLDCANGIVKGANSQVKNHSDSSLLYRMNPYLFRLLTDNIRCGDSDNFNFLLSQQVVSFDIPDEELDVTEAGKSWNGSSMTYGNTYTGKTSGDFTCNFIETSDLSVMKLLKLWMTYIDNVATGAWSPSYDLHGTGSFGRNIDDSHVYRKALDYGASVYVLKCDPTGEEVLYWTKYFGVFPVSTGASALSWDGSVIGSESPKLTIKFRYCFKRDLSPISLVEFNCQSQHTENEPSEQSFDPRYNHSSRPFVGAPFVELYIPPAATSLGRNADMYGKQRPQIRLKFKKYSDANLSDEILYRSNITGRSRVRNA